MWDFYCFLLFMVDLSVSVFAVFNTSTFLLREILILTWIICIIL